MGVTDQESNTGTFIPGTKEVESIIKKISGNPIVTIFSEASYKFG